MFNPNYDTLLLTSQTKEENQIGSQWEFDKHGYMYGMKEDYMYIFNRIVPKQVFLSEKKKEAWIKALDQVQALPKPCRAQNIYI